MNLCKEMEKMVPIPAYPSRKLCKVFRKQGIKIDKNTKLDITEVTDSGDVGGIMCTIENDTIFVVSLTHLTIKDHPLADKILAYQRERKKRISRERYR